MLTLKVNGCKPANPRQQPSFDSFNESYFRVTKDVSKVDGQMFIPVPKTIRW